MPATWVANDSICGSLTAAALKIGVSTSSTLRSLKKSRARLQHGGAPRQRPHASRSAASSFAEAPKD